MLIALAAEVEGSATDSNRVLPLEDFFIDYGKSTKNLAGAQQIRRKANHCIFGAGVFFGDGLFITISPNRRHSCLVLKLSRARANDTSLNSPTDVAQCRKKFAGAAKPSLKLPNGEAEEQVLEIPLLEHRQAMQKSKL